MGPTGKSPVIIAHRGSSAAAPENTLAAFARAFRDGADGIEFDVRLARDGVPVVIHDPSFRQKGLRKARVARLTSTRLAEIDVGSWFNRKHPQLARFQYMRQTVPTLDQVFRLLANQSKPDLIAYVELKAVRKRRSNAALAAAVIDAIDRHKLRNQTVVISFNLAILRKIREIDSAIRIGTLFGSRQRTTRSSKKMIKSALDCGASEILLHHRIVTRRFLRLAREARLAPVVWTVDDPKWVGKAHKHSIHALITNCPANMLSK